MRITLPSGTPAELVQPDPGPADRGLVVIPDIGGLRPLFDEHVQRLSAENGWSVCAIEPWPGREDLPLDERLATAGTIADDQLLGDAVAAAEATGCETVGVIGFCMGGMFTLKAAGTGRFHRAVAFYGMIHVPDNWRAEGQSDPFTEATKAGACPTMAIIGTVDPYTPAADVDELEVGGVEVVRYEGRDHGFVHAPDRPAHHADDAADAWQRAIAFLSQ
jgi:carboxymethylenebutenolidase